MKPRTKLECEIVELSSYLPKETVTQVASAQYKCFDHKARALKSGRLDCLECGGIWKDKHPGKTVVCPHCGYKLNVEFSTKKNFKQIECFAILDVVCGYQVIRLFEIMAYMKVGQPIHYAMCEVVQRWMMPKGRKEWVILAVGTSNGNYSWNSHLEVRNEFYNSYGYNFEKYNPIPSYICPGWKVWPEIRRNGFTGNCYGITPHKLFKAILTNTITETLIKTKQTSLLAYYIYRQSSKICDTWRSICICNRHGYIVRNAEMWLDHISMLRRLGKDVSNAKYICPKNLKAEHDRLTKIINFREKKVRDQIQREKARADEARFQELKGKYFGITFSDGELQVRVLESVDEFFEEGKAMHHCVFASEYYLKPDTLILSAMIGGKRIETVEVSLKTMQVVQSRGTCNFKTEYHDKIVGLVNRELKKQIKQRINA